MCAGSSKMCILIVSVVLFSVFHCALCHSPLSEQTSLLEVAASNRLPHDIIPLSYHIRLTPYFQVNNFTFDGLLWFYFNVSTHNIHDIILNSVNLTVINVKLEHRTNSSTFVAVDAVFDVDIVLGRLIVTTKVPLTQNTKYALTVIYNGPLRGSDELHGFYYGSYIENNQTV